MELKQQGCMTPLSAEALSGKIVGESVKRCLVLIRLLFSSNFVLCSDSAAKKEIHVPHFDPR